MRVNPLGKYFSRTLSADEGVIAYAKYVARHNAAGAEVTAATITRQANSLLFIVNAVNEVVIGTYTGNSGGDNEIVYADAPILSPQNLVDTINGYGAGMIAAGTTFNRWKASIGDYRPGYVIGAGDVTAVAAANALLGVDHDGLEIFADQSNHAVPDTISIAVGGPTCARGTWEPLPDHFESDYTSTTAGVITQRRFSRARRLEEQHGVVQQQCFITDIYCGMTWNNNDAVITVYDQWDQVVWTYPLGAALFVPPETLNKDRPIEGPMGSPLFVEIAGTGVFADGAVTVQGRVHVA